MSDGPSSANFADGHILGGLYHPDGELAGVATARAQAAMLVRRMANQHGCGPRCRSRNHRRDVALAQHYLAATGLDEVVPYVAPREQHQARRRDDAHGFLGGLLREAS